MATPKEPVTIKKYANRRLYNTGTSTYVTLDDLASMVKNGEDFVVFDAKTGEEITRSVLTQIIFEQESRGPNLLPIAFLRQLIRFYGDSLQNLVPTYLDFSLDALTRNQEKLRGQLGQGFGATPLGMAEEQVRQNTEIFQNAMRMFLPFSAPQARSDSNRAEEAANPPTGKKTADDLDQLKRQLDEVQKQLAKLAKKS